MADIAKAIIQQIEDSQQQIRRSVRLIERSQQRFARSEAALHRLEDLRIERDLRAPESLGPLAARHR